MGFFKKKKETDDGYYQGPGWAKLSSIVCARCGCDLHLIRKDQIKTINGKQYCDVCADYFNRLASAPKHFCVACNRIFPAPEMTTIYGNRICKGCATKYWSGKLPGLKLDPVNAPIGRINVAGKASDPIRKTAPANVLCVKCGTSMVNDGTIRHMGDKYYCKTCYDKMAEKRLPKDTSSNQTAADNGVPSNFGKYTDGIDYVLQYRPDDDIYYVEIHDLTGKHLADVDWFPGKMGYAAFVLTEDEYNLKMVHNDDAKFNELVGKFLDNLPKDRFIGAGSIVMGSNERGELRLEIKNETMDDHAYQKYRNQRAVPYIKSLDSVFVTFMRATGDQIPSVDGFGYAWVFSKKEYANAIIQKNQGVDMFCREFNKDGLMALVKAWYHFGISRFKLNPGTNDRYAEIDRDDFLPIEGIKKWNIVGSSLNQLIIRFKQNNAIQNNPMAHATAMTMWSSICHELYRSVFLVPITYDDEPYNVEDWVIHTSLAGAERLTQAEIERQIGDRIKDGSKLVAEDQNGNPIYMLKEDLIYGSEKYHFAKDGEVTPGKIMHLRTLLNNGTTFLCGFTDFEALHKVFGENVRVAVQSYEEIIAHMNDAVSDSTAIQGFVINPGTNELILSRENIEYAAKEKNEPGKIYTADDKKEN